MAKDIIPKDTFSDLRKRAEEILDSEPEDGFNGLSPEEIRKLIHELNVHQIELEMQNDELRRTRLELEEARDRYIDLYDYAPTGYLSLSDEAIVTDANLTSATMLGTGRTLLIGKPFSHFISRETQDTYYLFLQDIIKTKTRQVCELKIKKKGGKNFHVLSEAIPIFDEDGDISQIWLSLNNIDERKRAEETLHKYKHIVSTSTDMLAFLDNQFRYIAANEAYTEAFELTPEQLIGNTVANVFGEEFFNTVIKPKADSCFGGEIVRYQDWFDFPAFERRFMDITYYPYYSEDKKITGFVVNGRNITARKQDEEDLHRSYDELETRVAERTAELLESNRLLTQEIDQRKEAEEQLIRSKEMLQEVFDGIKEPLVLLNKNMRVKLLNKTAAEYYGVSDYQQVIGEFCQNVFQGESDLCEGCRIPLAISNVEDMVFERQGFKDPQRVEKVFVYQLERESEDPGGVIVRIADITEKKLFDKQIIQSEKLASLGILVSSIAHEINNPNAFISFNIPILREYVEKMIGIVDRYYGEDPDLELFHMPYPEFRKDIFGLIDNLVHGSDRINSFVANLREFSRTRYTGKPKWVDLKSVVEKAVSICRTKVSKTINSFTHDIPEGFPQVFTDPYALEHVLINLLLNAAQASDKEDSWIKLRAILGSTWLDRTIIEVKDNGCGIDQEDLKFIFDPFFTTKTVFEGTGLGLYVCHNLVEAIKGRIEVETEPGAYSTFRIIIPDMDRRSESREPAPSEERT